MLAYLHVKNIALIEELEIDFAEGLNILTGETGAGKSIILGSIHYVLGAKIKKDFIRTGAQEAFVECIFDFQRSGEEEKAVQHILDTYGIQYQQEEGLILSRKMAQNGRSVFRVNGEVVRKEVIHTLATHLIDIHSQHEHQSLLYPKKQLHMLDRYIGDDLATLQKLFYESYKQRQQLLDTMENHVLDDEQRRREISFLEFVIDEIEQAELRVGEDEEQQALFDSLSQRQNILRVLSDIEQTFYHTPDVSALISQHIGELNRVVRYDKVLSHILEGFIQLEDTLHGIHKDVSAYMDDDCADEEALKNVEERLNTINGLKLKYGNGIEEILAYQEEKQKELERLIHYEETMEETKKRIIKLDKALKEYASQMTCIRKQGAKKLEKDITDALKALNLEEAVFGVCVYELEAYVTTGADRVVFEISTNKGEGKKPLSQVASGGELSRVMLAIKSILSTIDGVDTLIFDEIDTGISGITAQKVAERMQRLSLDRQLICITHLPQIAAMADSHFLIHKETVGNGTVTEMNRLEDEASVYELARMLSGAVTTESALANAREMKLAVKK